MRLWNAICSLSEQYGTEDSFLQNDIDEGVDAFWSDPMGRTLAIHEVKGKLLADDVVITESSTDDITKADIVTSITGFKNQGAMHAPVIDLDVPARLIPSSTPGHSHLYIDVEMRWDQYEKILEALADAGVVERGYVDASRTKGYSAVRMPWRKKRKK